MQVTKIQEITKNRVKVTVDNEFSFVLYKGELRLYKIKEECELIKESYDEIFNIVLPKRAKLRAMNLLKIRPYTVKGLTDKLLEGGYPDEIVKVAIEYVSSYHYLDDLNYAKEYIYTYKDRKNLKTIKFDLIKKGVPKDLIEEALNDELPDSRDYEQKQIIEFINKKKKSYDEFNYENKMKVLASLYRKGYNVELSKKLLDIT